MKKSKFSDEQIVRILQEDAKGEITQAELFRQHNISENTFYLWKRRYGSMKTENMKRLKELERKNTQLKCRVSEMMLAFRSPNSPKPWLQTGQDNRASKCE